MNKLFINNGKLKFSDVADAEGLDAPSFSNGAAYADLDNDGDLDLVINNIDQPVFIYRNNSEKINRGQFIRVDLNSTNSADYYNTKVSIYYGDKLQLQEYSPSRGFQSCVEHTLHFGFDKEIELIDSIVVDWVDNYREVIKVIRI